MLPPIDVDDMVVFLTGLLNTPSPTGDTDAAMGYVQKAFAGLPFSLEMTPKGLLSGTWPGQSADRPRAVTAHVDTLGG
ncbi:MAG TPA: peptidase M42, partial [Anaerolineae bacterium]|nr:peptidase M42 [Anaerolineae bacterium]